MAYTWCWESPAGEVRHSPQSTWPVRMLLKAHLLGLNANFYLTYMHLMEINHSSNVYTARKYLTF